MSNKIIYLENSTISETNERAALASFELSKEAALKLNEELTEEHFFKPENKRLFNIFSKLVIEGSDIKPSNVNPLIPSDDISLKTLYLGLEKENVKEDEIEKYIEVLKHKLQYRRLEDIYRDIGNNLKSGIENPISIADSLQNKITKLSDDSSKEDDSFNSILENIIPDPNNIKEIESGLLGIPSGIKSLDEYTLGWQPGHLIIIGARPSVGKALTMDSDILTPSGFIKMKEVNVGTKVAGSDGNFYNVNGVFHQGKKHIYRIIFSDKSYVDSSEDHLWEVTSRNGRINRNKNEFYIRNTKYIKDHLKRENNKRNNFAINYCSPIKFNNKRFLPIHPYNLGVYIGNGYSNKTTVNITTADLNIINRVKYNLNKQDSVTQYTYNEYGIKRKIRNKNTSEFYKSLKYLNLNNKTAGYKFIPKIYLFSSVQDRINLLQGLMDTDGEVNKPNGNSFSYCSKSEQLINDIIFLIRSLGGHASKSKKYNKKYKRYYYTLYGRFNNGIIPFYCYNKRKFWKGNSRTKYKFITDIKYIGKKECQCISVDSPNNLFITNSFNITHNTEISIQFAINCAKNENKRCIFFSIETTKLSLFNRILCHMTGIPMQRVRLRKFNDYERDLIKSNYDELKSLPLTLVDDPIMTTSKIYSRIKREQYLKGDIGLIIIDYLQLMKGNNANRVQEISQISWGLKIIAKQLNIPIITLSQLSRAIEVRNDNWKESPLLSDLRDGGSIEQDADEIIFLTAEDRIDKETGHYLKNRKTKLWLAKQKDGPTGVFDLINQCDKARFIEDTNTQEDDWFNLGNKSNGKIN